LVNKKILILFCLIILSINIVFSQSIVNLSLTSSPSNRLNLTTDNLTCNYVLNQSATTSAVSWYKNNNPTMALYMPFEGNSTNALKDFSGNGNSATNIGGALWNATGGYDNKGAFKFDGSGSYVNVLNISWPIGSPVSVVFWNYALTQNLVTGASAFSFGEDTGQRFQAQAPWSDNVLSWDYGAIGANGRLTTSYVAYLNKWTFVVLISNGSALNYQAIYLDGILANSQAVNNYPNSVLNGVTIGMGIGNYHNGSIADFRIYNYTLSQEQILSLYNNRTDLIVSQETNLNDVYQCRVTPFNSTLAGITYQSNNLTIRNFVKPNVTFVSSTYSSGTQIMSISFPINVSLSGDYYNATIKIYNSTGNLKNQTWSSVSPFYILRNFTNGIYFYNATTYSYNGSFSNTETRNITLLLFDLSFVSPTYQDYYIINKNHTYINVSSNTELHSCMLEWNGINETMTIINTNTSYINKTNLGEGEFSYKVWCNDTMENYVSTTLRHLETDYTDPFIQFYNPMNPVTYVYDNITLDFNVTDINLFRINVTMFNSTYGVVWNYYQINITNQTYNYQSNSNLSQGYQNYTLEVCGADDHTDGDKLKKDVKDKNKIEFTDKNNKTTNLEIRFEDDTNKKITILEQIDFQFDENSDKWNFEFNATEKMYYVYINVTTDDEIFDRSFRGKAGHFVFGNNYHDFSVMSNYTQNGVSKTGFVFSYRITDNNYMIKFVPYDVINKDDIIFIDPMTGGLNTNCKNRTIEYFPYVPTTNITYPTYNLSQWGLNQDVNVSFYDQYSEELDYCYLDLLNSDYTLNKTISSSFVNTTKINYSDLYYGNYYLNATCYNTYGFSDDDLSLVYVYCDETWVEHNTICDNNFQKSKYYEDSEMCGSSYTIPIDNGTIVNCECDDYNLNITTSNLRYCDFDDDCYVYADSSYNDSIENNITLKLNIDNVNYTMSYSDSVWYKNIISNISEDVNYNVWGWTEEYETHNSNISCSSDSGLLRYRDAYYVTIQLYKQTPSNETKKYCGDFDYIYLKYTNMTIGEISPVSLEYKAESYNWLNNYLKTRNKREYGVDLSFGRNKIDETIYFWNTYSSCEATIQLFERGGHDIYILNAKVTDDSYSYEPFYKPSRLDNPDLDVSILKGYNFNNTGTLKILVNPLEVIPYSIVDKILFTLTSIFLVLLLHIAIIGIMSIFGQFGMQVGFHVSGIFAVLTIPILIILNVILWVF